MYYSPNDATSEIKKRLRNGGRLVFIPHAEAQMQARNIDSQEVQTAVQSGAVRIPGELTEGEYRYKIESNLNGGIAVAVEIPEGDPNVIVITVFSPKKRKH